jgi:hypothetical protein
MEQRWTDNRQGKTGVLEYKHVPIPLRQPQIPLELSLGIIGERPATNRVRNEAAKLSTACMVQEEKE